jgi:hypothetical protein
MSSIYSSYYYGEEDVTMLYASVGVFGIGMITQMIATTSIGMSSIRLGKSIAREGSDAPRPKGAAVWSLLSAGSLGVAFLCSSMMYSDVLYSDFIFEAVGILELTSIVSAGVTYFSVKGYGAEIGWAEYRQARETALMSPENEFRSLAFAATGRPHLRIPVPLLSIGY